jgi:Spy/CpxP family protein refolding chaperone
MKMAHSLPRSIIVPVILGAVTMITLLAASDGAEPVVPSASPALPVAGAAESSAPDSSHPFFMPESVLTAEQRARYRTAVEASRGRVQELDAQLQVVRHELNEAVLAEHLDEVQVREKATVIAQLEGEKAVLRARAFAAIRPTLTPEQVGLLRARTVGPRPKATPEQMEARRKEVKAHLETRLAEEHEAKRQQLAVKLEAEIAELNKKQASGPLTPDEKERLSRLERMRNHIKAGGE